jgi:hypothetical protein
MYEKIYTMAMRAEKAALRRLEILSPWNTFFGDISHRNIEIQCRPITRKTQCPYSVAYTVKAVTRADTVPSLQRNWNITPSHVRTNRCTF